MSTEFIFFSGKGGVGKTSMACTTAVRLADEGKKTLIVTTDPASNLADVFEQPIGHQITPIAGVPNLWAMEIDPDKATTGVHRPRHGADPRRLPAADRAGDGRADERPLHGRGGGVRPLRRLPRPAGQRARRRGAGAGLRHGHLRHRADRAHDPPAGTARRVEPLHRRRRRPAAGRPASAPRPPSRTPSTSTSVR